MEINIVGMFSNSDEITEIVDVAKVFIIEERMKGLYCDTETKNIAKNRRNISSKKTNLQYNYGSRNIQYLTVRGFN